MYKQERLKRKDLKILNLLNKNKVAANKELGAVKAKNEESILKLVRLGYAEGIGRGLGRVFQITPSGESYLEYFETTRVAKIKKLSCLIAKIISFAFAAIAAITGIISIT